MIPQAVYDALMKPVQEYASTNQLEIPEAGRERELAKTNRATHVRQAEVADLCAAIRQRHLPSEVYFSLVKAAIDSISTGIVGGSSLRTNCLSAYNIQTLGYSEKCLEEIRPLEEELKGFLNRTNYQGVLSYADTLSKIVLIIAQRHAQAYPSKGIPENEFKLAQLQQAVLYFRAHPKATAEEHDFIATANKLLGDIYRQLNHSSQSLDGSIETLLSKALETVENVVTKLHSSNAYSLKLATESAQQSTGFEAEHAQWQQTKEELTTRAEAAEARVAELEAENQDLRSELDAAHESEAAALKHAGDADAGRAQWQQTKEEFTTRAEAAEARVAELEAENQDLRSELDAAHESEADALERAGDADAENEGADGLRAQLAEQGKEMQRLLEQLGAESKAREKAERQLAQERDQRSRASLGKFSGAVHNNTGGAHQHNGKRKGPRR